MGQRPAAALTRALALLLAGLLLGGCTSPGPAPASPAPEKGGHPQDIDIDADTDTGAGPRQLGR